MKKNAIIREHLAATAQERRSKNKFRFGAIEVTIDHDSPHRGIEFQEGIKVSIYNPDTDIDVIIWAKIESVDILTSAVGG